MAEYKETRKDDGLADSYKPNSGIGSLAYDRLCAEEVRREDGRFLHDAGVFSDFRLIEGTP